MFGKNFYFSPQNLPYFKEFGQFSAKYQYEKQIFVRICQKRFYNWIWVKKEMG